MTLVKPTCTIVIDDKVYYLVEDVADMFGVDWRTVMRWLEDDKLTRVKYPRGICIPADEAEAYFWERNGKSDRPEGAPPPRPKPSDGPGRADS